MSKNITIYTIATEAGVSVSTVSRYLTGNANVSEDKRRKIEEIIEKYDFRPNAIARNLSNQETKMLGFILPDVSSPFFGTTFIEAERRALELGYTILLCNTMNDNINNPTHMEIRYIEFLLEKQIDGLIMLGGHIDNTQMDPVYTERISNLLKNTPVVVINGEIEGLDSFSIRTNDTIGIEALVNYLVSLKHERIGFVGGISNIQPTSRRLQAMKQCLARHDIKFKEQWFIENDFSIEAGKQCLEELLQRGDDLTAVICVNDLVAIGVIYAAARVGLRIPEDLSVTGIDNIYLAEYMTPAITTIDLQPKKLGSLAVEMLVGYLQGEHTKKKVILDTQTVIRESCIRRK